MDKNTSEFRLQLQSPLLREMPESGIRWKWFALRFTVFTIMALFIALFLFSVAYHWWDKTSLSGLIVYWLHDNVYLQLKGNIHTALFPDILIVWGPALTILTIMLVSWLSGTSLIGQFHVLLVRWAVARRSILYPILIIGIRAFALVGIKPDFIWEVVSSEHEQSLSAVDQNRFQPKLIEPCCWAAHHWAVFLLYLATYYGTSSAHHSAAIEHWLHTYVLIGAYAKTIKPEKLEAIQSEMRVRLDNFLQHYPPPTKVFTREEMFDLDKLKTELKDLITIQGSDLDSGQQTVLQIKSRLMDAVDNRREWLNQRYIQFQAELTNVRIAKNSPKRSYGTMSFPDDLKKLASIGRLTKDMALYITIITGQPWVAQAYIHSCESLILLTESFYLHLNTTERPYPIYIVYTYLTGNIASEITDTYPLLHAANVSHLLAYLSTANLKQIQQNWEFELIQQNPDLIHKVDFLFEEQLLGMEEAPERSDSGKTQFDQPDANIPL